MGEQRRIDVTVMVDEDHRDKLAQVAGHLKSKGFVLAQSLGELGVLTGSAPADAIAELSAVAGVAAVEESRTDYRTQE